MSNHNPETPGFTLRAALIAIALSLFLLTSSSYVAIRIGAQPWPIIFSVIISGAILKLLNGARKVSVHEANVAQAGGSIGGLVAAGVVFTLPGILYLNNSKHLDIAWPNPWVLALLTALAGVLGVLLSVPLKYTFVDEEKLPYPSGTAGAELLKLGQTGGRQLFFVITMGAAAGVFTLIRDLLFPAGFSFATLTSLGILLTILPLPLAIGGGYILGGRAGFSWFLGAIVGWVILVPLLHQNAFSTESARGWVQNLGMGMVLGSGIGFFVSYILPRFKQTFLPLLQTRERYLRFFPGLALLGIGALWLAGVPLFAALLSVLGVWMMVAVAARMTGETNIDPLEQFGIFTGLVIALVYKLADLQLSVSASFMIVTFVSVACAIAGDAGHDYKSSVIVGTRFFDIVKVDIITVIASGLAAPFVLETIRRGFADALFTPAMPAPQAQMVAGSIFGFEFPWVFTAGFALAFMWEVSQRIVPPKFKDKILLMPLGIGLFLGLGLAIPLALGALIRGYVDRRASHLYTAGLLIAAAVMGGEGLAGFSAGALAAAGVPFETGAHVLLAIFVIVLFLALWVTLRYKGPETREI
ncbi:MAG TPA: OPT/YSL family transporter [bacterium]